MVESVWQGASWRVAYDGLDRLADVKRGNLNPNKDAIGTGGDRVRGQAWALDALGNWADFQIDADGDGLCSETGTEDFDQD